MSNRLYSDKTTIKYKYGFWYEHPFSLTLDGWTEWRDSVKKNHPVQYFIREFVGDTRYTLRRWYRNVKNGLRWVFNPYHQDIRKAVPRNWADITSLVVDVNFAMILSFKKEADGSFVDWNGTEKHREFKNWLDSAVHWITIGRPNCQAQADASYPPHPLPDHMKGKTYEELYGELNKIEELIAETDSNILKKMIDYRDYMWT
jgi:hypothetical protein